MRKLRGNQFLMGSLVMIIGSNLYNGGQFVYHFLGGRLLGKAQYGDLAAIISILGIIGIVMLSVNLTIVKYIATSDSEEDVKNFSRWAHYWALMIGIALAVGIVFITPFLSASLQISDTRALYLLAPIVFSYILVVVLRSMLQGMMKFNWYVSSMLIEAAAKILFTIVFVVAGFALFGAVLGTLLGVCASYAVGYYSMRQYVAGKRGKRPDILPLVKYSVPTFVQGLALTSMYSTDLLLVKHYFSPQEAGLYAALAILGRVVFFGTMPVTQVMFPAVAKKHAAKAPYYMILGLSIVLILSFSIAVTMGYAILPTIPLGVLYGTSYLDGAPLLPWFAVFMGLLALCANQIQFYLSIGKVKIIGAFLAAAIIQIVGIMLYHDSLLSVIQVSIATAALLLAALFIYFAYHVKNH